MRECGGKGSEACVLRHDEWRKSQSPSEREKGGVVEKFEMRGESDVFMSLEAADRTR